MSITNTISEENYQDNVVRHYGQDSFGSINKMYRYKNRVNNNGQFENSKLMEYVTNNPDNTELNAIVKPDISTRYLSTYDYYKKIIENNMIYVLNDIVDGSNSVDEIIIFKYAIENKRYDLLDILIDSGFDLNNYNPLFFSTYLRGMDTNMCKYFVSKGIDLQICCQYAYNTIGSTTLLPTDDILCYILDFITDKNILLNIFIIYHTQQSFGYLNYVFDFNTVKKIVETGVVFDTDFAKLLCYFGKYKPTEIQYLLNSGLQLDNSLLGYAFRNLNTDLVDFLLDYGLVIDHNVIKRIFIDCEPSVIALLSKYNVDFEQINNEYEVKHRILINAYNDMGLSKDALIGILLDNFEDVPAPY